MTKHFLDHLIIFFGYKWLTVVGMGCVKSPEILPPSGLSHLLRLGVISDVLAADYERCKVNDRGASSKDNNTHARNNNNYYYYTLTEAVVDSTTQCTTDWS